MESNRRKSKWQSSPRPRPLAPKHFRLAPLHPLRRTQRSNLPARRRSTNQPRPLRPPQPLPRPPPALPHAPNRVVILSTAKNLTHSNPPPQTASPRPIPATCGGRRQAGSPYGCPILRRHCEGWGFCLCWCVCVCVCFCLGLSLRFTLSSRARRARLLRADEGSLFDILPTPPSRADGVTQKGRE